jgi:hypothetical protein
VGAGSGCSAQGGFDLERLPSQAIVPAGEHGVVQFRCSRYKYNGLYNAKLLQPGRDGSRPIYERPIVTFKVGPGEVVDIGSVILPSKTTLEGGFMGNLRNEFIAAVQPMPEPLLQNLAQSYPNLFKARVVRPMMVPPPVRS